MGDPKAAPARSRYTAKRVLTETIRELAELRQQDMVRTMLEDEAMPAYGPWAGVSLVVAELVRDLRAPRRGATSASSR